MKNDIPYLGQKYVECIESTVDALDPNILLYGSTVYGVVSSDLDISMIVKDYSPDDYERIKEKTIRFQREHNMDLDEEVPFSSKLIYRTDDVRDMIENTPFKKVNGIYRITPVEKNSTFLSSKEMKYRLLLNILTTRSLLLRGDSQEINDYRQQAWDTLTRVILSYNSISEMDIDRFLSLLSRDEKNNLEGEMFLGYKSNIPQKKVDLREDADMALQRLVAKGKAHKNSSGIYVFDKDWIHE